MLKDQASARSRLLATILFSAESHDEKYSLLIRMFNADVEVFPQAMIQSYGKQYTWNRVHKKGQPLPDPSANDSGRITRMHNLQQNKEEKVNNLFLNDFFRLTPTYKPFAD